MKFEKMSQAFVLAFLCLVILFSLTSCQEVKVISGADGKNGLDGKSAYDLAVQEGFEGTLEEWLFLLKGEDGKDGKDGERGEDGEHGLSSYELAVQDGFDGGLDEWLKSLQGEDGTSAYELAVQNGFEGTLEEWLNFLKGEKGENGERGLSAFELAVQEGFEGTLEGWLDSLKGEEGNGIVSVLKTDTNDDFDTFTITYSNGESSSVTIEKNNANDPSGGVCALIASSTPNAMPTLSTTKKTFTLPLDTLLIDSRLPGGWISITKNCSTVTWTLETSAICIYYDISNNSLLACAYNEVPEYKDYILVCAIRNNGTNNYATCSLPVTIDGNEAENETSQNEVVCWGDHSIRAVSHRGYSKGAPENTLSAYRLAKQKGFQYVECDVSFTMDGVPVLLHDETIDRTSNGSGMISGLTFDELQAFDFGSWFSADYAGEKIPSFEEFILLCRNLGLHPYIELKSGLTRERAQVLVKLVKRYGMENKVTWISASINALTYIRSCDDSARLGFIVADIGPISISDAKTLQTEHNEVFIDVLYSNLTEEKALLCLDADLALEVWTVNSSADICNLDPYVTGVTSDYLIAGKVLCDKELE